MLHPLVLHVWLKIDKASTVIPASPEQSWPCIRSAWYRSQKDASKRRMTKTGRIPFNETAFLCLCAVFSNSSFPCQYSVAMGGSRVIISIRRGSGESHWDALYSVLLTRLFISCIQDSRLLILEDWTFAKSFDFCSLQYWRDDPFQFHLRHYSIIGWEGCRWLSLGRWCLVQQFRRSLVTVRFTQEHFGWDVCMMNTVSSMLPPWKIVNAQIHSNPCDYFWAPTFAHEKLKRWPQLKRILYDFIKWSQWSLS